MNFPADRLLNRRVYLIESPVFRLFPEEMCSRGIVEPPFQALRNPASKLYTVNIALKLA